MNPDYLYSMNSQMIFQCPLCSSVPDNQRDEFINDLQFSVREYEKMMLL